MRESSRLTNAAAASQPIGGTPHTQRTAIQHVRVNHRGAHVCMVRRKRVPERVAAGALRDPRLPPPSPHAVRRTRAGDNATADPTADRDTHARPETRTATPTPSRRWDTSDRAHTAARPRQHRCRDHVHAGFGPQLDAQPAAPSPRLAVTSADPSALFRAVRPLDSPQSPHL